MKFTVRARVYCDYTTEIEVDNQMELQEFLDNIRGEISVYDLEIQDVEIDDVCDENGEAVDSTEINLEDDEDE